MPVEKKHEENGGHRRVMVEQGAIEDMAVVRE